MGWLDQYCENGYATKSSLQVQKSDDIQHTDWKVNTKVLFGLQKMTNSWDNTEQKSNIKLYYRAIALKKA
jgi:hypothetical protein